MFKAIRELVISNMECMESFHINGDGDADDTALLYHTTSLTFDTKKKPDSIYSQSSPLT